MKYMNVATWDRIARVVLGLVLLYLGWAGVVTGVWGEVLKYGGFIPLLTGAFGYCPLYGLLKFRTNHA